MPLITKDKKQYLISRVRLIIAQDPQISLEELADRLERDHQLKFERHYLSALVNKIFRERAARADRYTLNQALAAFEDTMTQVVRKAWEIANNQFADDKARVMALREILEANKAVFDKLFDAGVFERKLGTLDAVIRNTPLSEERKQGLRSAFDAWKLLPPPVDAKPER